MKKLLLTLLAGVCVINSNACVLHFDEDANLGIYLQQNSGFQPPIQANVAFNHIVPRQRLLQRLNLIFQGRNLNQIANRGLVRLLAEQYANTPNNFYSNNNQTLIQKNNTVVELNRIADTGRDIANEAINGLGNNCAFPVGLNVAGVLSYMPSDGYFGPNPIFQDPGDDFDTYGNFFINNNQIMGYYRNLNNTNNTNDAFNNLRNILTYYNNNHPIAAYNVARWMLAPQQGRVCLRTAIGVNQCVERPPLNQYFSGNDYNNGYPGFSQTEYAEPVDAYSQDYSGTPVSQTEVGTQETVQDGAVSQ